jgi:hypothetical protein
MLRAALTRKNQVTKYIAEVKSLPPKEHNNEAMCFCYVLAFAAIEFMAESIIRGWVQHNIRKHKYPYRGKAHVDNVIGVLSDLAELNLRSNHSMDYSRICELLEKLAGTVAKDNFRRSVRRHKGGVRALNVAIDNIKTTRHNVAHGVMMPNDISPNLAQLETDFNHVYACLIENLNRALPRI